MSTQSFKEHIKTVQDQLSSAAQKQDDQAKAAIRSAMDHLKAAHEELQAERKQDREMDKAEADRTMAKLQEISNNAKAALDEQGTQLHAHIEKMVSSIKGVTS
jgi:hypothetical protein